MSVSLEDSSRAEGRYAGRLPLTKEGKKEAKKAIARLPKSFWY